MTDPTATPLPGGQPQALTDQERQWGDESDAYLRALLDAHTPSKQHGDEKFPGRCMHCSYTREPCDTASAAAAALVRSDALDEARSEIMRLQDNDSAYDVGYQRADAAAGAAIDWLRQERDEARARLAAVEAERDRAVEALDEQIRRLQVAIERARDFPCPECGHRLVVACAHGVCQAAETAPAAPTAGGEGHDDD
jgi:hypothetical protein